MIRRILQTCSVTSQSLCRMFAAALMLMTTATYGQEKSIWRIEEDWQMVIYQPDPSINSPQVSFFVSPSDETKDTYFQLQMNYAADEDFSAGGFQVAAVSGGEIVDEERSRHRITLATSNDQIRWTSAMAVWEEKLVFAVKDGSGTQWGTFGGPEYLVRVSPCPVRDLNGYKPSRSLESVDIGFGGNRVQEVRLRNVRYYYTDGTVRTEEIDSVVQR